MTKFGYKHTEETRRRLREARRGFKHTEATKKKISESHIGEKNPFFGKKFTKESLKKMSIASKGKPKSKEHRANMSGFRNHNWKGGVTPINHKIRNSLQMKLWREAVFARDAWQCVWGGREHGNELHADHIKPFALFPELRFSIDNGRTLCVDCHKKTDTFCGRTKPNRCFT